MSYISRFRSSMSSNVNTLKQLCLSLQQNLSGIFETNDSWTSTHAEIYHLLKLYVETYQEKGHLYEARNDKAIISDNLKDQVWFVHSKSKPILIQLLNNMKVVHYASHDSKHNSSFDLIVSFGQFKLGVCFYKSKLNGFINSYIYFEKKDTTSVSSTSTHPQTQKAYLTFYVNPPMTGEKIPDFEQIYQIIHLNPNILCQGDLTNFVSEVVMYYDEFGFLGNLPISNEIPLTLNQLNDKLNQFVSQKMNSEGQYTIV